MNAFRLAVAAVLVCVVAFAAAAKDTRPLTRRNTLVTPAVSLDFTTNSAFGACQGVSTKCISASRATTTTYAQNSSGVYQSFAANTVRLTDLGALAEASTVNVVFHSRDLTIVTQVAVSGGSGTFTNGETVTATGGGTGVYVLAESSGTQFAIRNATGTFSGTLTGGTSGATKTIGTVISAWVRSTMSATQDQTGITGVASSATRITATGANATLLEPTTIASGVRWQSAFIKQVTGVGTLEMTQDNASTWTILTSAQCFNTATDPATPAAINLSTWVRCQIPSQTLANPTVGFRIATNGDEFAIDMVQNETGNNVSSPFPLTTTNGTRASDVYNAAGPLLDNLKGTVGSVIVEMGGLPLNAAANTYRMIGGNGTNATNGLISNSALSAARCNAASSLTAIFGVGDILSPWKVGLAWDATGRTCVANNGPLGTDALTWSASTTVNVSGNSSGTVGIGGFIKRIKVWPVKIKDSYLKAQTL